ncbi:MAG: hypothetical protein R3C02_21055, partial [Planctomycetaceae bacterium]
SLELRERIVERFGESPQSLRDVTLSYERMAGVHLQPDGEPTAEDLQTAAGFLQRSLANWDTIRQRWGATPDALEGPFFSAFRMAQILLMIGQSEPAISLLEQTQTDLQTIVDNGWATQVTLQKLAATNELLEAARQAHAKSDD